MKRKTALVLAAMEPEYAYPIVDAKTYYIDSFPFLSYENGDSMMRFYPLFDC